MEIALVHNHFDAAHLEEVKTEMMTIGAPVIRAVWMGCYERFAALEGCHRIRAAHALGLTPVIDEIEYSDEITVCSLGLDFDMNDDMTIAQLVDDCHRRKSFTF